MYGDALKTAENLEKTFVSSLGSSECIGAEGSIGSCKGSLVTAVSYKRSI